MIPPLNMISAPQYDLFSKANSIRGLAMALDEPFQRFTYIVFAKDREAQYIEYNIAKGYKKKRHIEAPVTALKNIQRKLHCLLKEVYSPPHAAHAFISNKSIVTNATVHLKAKTILKLDIKDFFPSINFGRVRGLFLASPFLFNSIVATTLAQICCKNNGLPQGAPTSPIIANMICRKLDTQLNRLAKNNFFSYTRYADDLTFSSNHKNYVDIELKDLENFGKQINNYVTANGFVLNTEKTKLLTKNDSKFITGVKVNEKLNVSRKQVRSVRAMLDSLEKNGPEASLKVHLEKWRRRKTLHQPNDYLQILFGKIAFLKMVKGKNDLCVLKLENRLNEWLNLRSNVSINSVLLDKIISLDKEIHAVIYTEGKSDRIHLRNAYYALRKKGFFQDLNIVFYEFTKDAVSGDTALKTLTDNASASEQHNGKLRIIVFDRDSKVHSKKDLRQYENNIFALALPCPEFRIDCKTDLSIEHYYNDNILYQEDENGRRLFNVSEFDKKTKKHKNDHKVSCTKLGNKGEHTIIDDNVLNTENKNIALSKTKFAKNISLGVFATTFDDLLVFKPLFDIIALLIKKYAYQIR